MNVWQFAFSIIALCGTVTTLLNGNLIKCYKSQELR